MFICSHLREKGKHYTGDRKIKICGAFYLCSILFKSMCHIQKLYSSMTNGYFLQFKLVSLLAYMLLTHMLVSPIEFLLSTFQFYQWCCRFPNIFTCKCETYHHLWTTQHRSCSLCFPGCCLSTLPLCENDFTILKQEQKPRY